MKRTTNWLTINNKGNFFYLGHEIGEYHKRTEKEKNNFYWEKYREEVKEEVIFQLSLEKSITERRVQCYR